MTFPDFLACAFHAHRVAQLTAQGKHAPEDCPCKDGHALNAASREIGPAGIFCTRCGTMETAIALCPRCDPLLRSWEALTDAQRDDLRREVAWAVEAVGPVLAECAAAIAKGGTGCCAIVGLYNEASLQPCGWCAKCLGRAALARLAELGVTP